MEFQGFGGEARRNLKNKPCEDQPAPPPIHRNSRDQRAGPASAPATRPLLQVPCCRSPAARPPLHVPCCTSPGARPPLHPPCCTSPAARPPLSREAVRNLEDGMGASQEDQPRGTKAEEPRGSRRARRENTNTQQRTNTRGTKGERGITRKLFGAALVGGINEEFSVIAGLGGGQANQHTRNQGPFGGGGWEGSSGGCQSLGTCPPAAWAGGRVARAAGLCNACLFKLRRASPPKPCNFKVLGDPTLAAKTLKFQGFGEPDPGCRGQVSQNLGVSRFWRRGAAQLEKQALQRPAGPATDPQKLPRPARRHRQCPCHTPLLQVPCCRSPAARPPLHVPCYIYIYIYIY